jgi:ParB-like nuclease domain
VYKNGRFFERDDQMNRRKSSDGEPEPKLDHVRVCPIDSIRPAPENEDIYNAIATDDPELVELARSIEERGLQEPILISQDGYIISGHRRRVAAYLAKLAQCTSSGSSD